jgi:GntR family transcriptional regulator
MAVFPKMDAEDRRPLYQQVVDGIKGQIARGDLREGMLLPSVRQLAGDLGVNLNTIAIAYRQLQEEGFVIVKHGAGATVASSRVRGRDRNQLRKALRNILTEMSLAGIGEDEVTAIVQAEFRLMSQKRAAG